MLKRLSLAASALVLVSCGPLDNKKSGPDYSSSISALKSVATIADLSGCWPNIEGEMRYVSSENKVVVCVNKEWKYIDFGATASASSLIKVDDVQPGRDCEYGGKAISTGLDDGAGKGEPGDSILSEDEIDSRQFICRETINGLLVADPVTNQPFATVLQVVDSSLVLVKSLNSKYMTVYELNGINGSLASSRYPKSNSIYFLTPDCSGQPYTEAISYDQANYLSTVSYQDYFLQFQKYVPSKAGSFSLNYNSILTYTANPDQSSCQTVASSRAVQLVKLDDSGFVFPRRGKLIAK